ncbi:NUDIX hydrolase [Gryllotalpicola reticulitermitis]|uniref:NUDIX hydrolase n=1 Tax=Gryllotalpicola reticulitermitis TaxID=1184153 RepID=A0ABV8QBP6_9MICO
MSDDLRGFDVEAMGRPSELLTVQHGERTLYDNPWVRLVKVDIVPPDGHRFEHHVVRLQTVALMLVVNDADEVLMLWRYRFPVDAWGWELPGGIVAPGEEPEVTAVRETVEETGWEPSVPTRLASFQPMPGMVDTPHVLFQSRGAVKVAEPSDEEEAAIVRWVPLALVRQLIDAGLVLGAGSLVALLRLLAGDAPA